MLFSFVLHYGLLVRPIFRLRPVFSHAEKREINFSGVWALIMLFHLAGCVSEITSSFRTDFLVRSDDDFSALRQLISDFDFNMMLGPCGGLDRPPRYGHSLRF